MIRTVTIEEARINSKNVGSYIHWRPNPNLPEEKQYAVIKEEGEKK